MVMKKVNTAVSPRTIRRKHSINEALFSLLETNRIEDITVTMISAKANITRKTFYSYYDSVYDLADSIATDYINQIEQLLTSVDIIPVLEDENTLREMLIYILKSNGRAFDFVIRCTSDKELVHKVQVLSVKIAKNNSKNKVVLDDKAIYGVVTYVVSGIIAVYRDFYLDNQSEKRFDEMISILIPLMKGGFQMIFK